jgi:hypothetical protein
MLDFPPNDPNVCPALFTDFALLRQFFSRRVVVIKDSYLSEDLG